MTAPFGFSPETLRGTDGGFVLEWTVPEDLEYFAGHFPGAPVLPAVAILEASGALVALSQGRAHVAIKGVPSAKFLAPIAPGAMLRIAFRATPDAWEFDWETAAERIKVAKLRIRV